MSDWREILPWLLLFTPIPPLAMVVLVYEHAWSDNLALRERVGIAIRDTAVAGFVALTSANYLFEWNLSNGLLMVLSLIAVAAISLPSLVWIVLYIRESPR